jgi:hypothetical protein
MLYLKLWFLANGTAEYAQTIRWCYLFGYFGKDPKATKKIERLDERNFIKWQKKTGKTYSDYLNVARV